MTENGDRESGLHIVVLGSGSAAFACAIRAAEEGAKVSLVEVGTVGGTCVNIGCVPSKVLLRAAHVAHLPVAQPFTGIEMQAPIIDRKANSSSSSRSATAADCSVPRCWLLRPAR